MSDFFKGLEKFGLSGIDMSTLFEENTEENKEDKDLILDKEKQNIENEEENEEDFLFDKNMKCPVCDKNFKNRTIRTSKLRRLGSDEDLRPRYKGIDTIKYDVSSCPYCGYTAMNRFFDGLSTLQIKLIKENVCSKFQPSIVSMPTVIDYETAIDRYKLALFNAIVKKGKSSEKAYTCLKISWLYRGAIDEMIISDTESDTQVVLEYQKEEKSFYEQAYEGFLKAIENESFPICGMDMHTVDFLIGEMAFRLQKYDVASKVVGRLLTSNANKHVKDKALVLKQNIIKAIKATQ